MNVYIYIYFNIYILKVLSYFTVSVGCLDGLPLFRKEIDCQTEQNSQIIRTDTHTN